MPNRTVLHFFEMLSISGNQLNQMAHLLDVDLGGRGAGSHFDSKRKVNALSNASHQARQLPRVAEQC
jgi:hypothetical protein